jgi:membrane protease YdiL (CAAX protease family)
LAFLKDLWRYRGQSWVTKIAKISAKAQGSMRVLIDTIDVNSAHVNRPLRQAAALLEVLGIYLAGPLVMTLVIRGFGLPISNPLTTLTVGVTDAELLRITWQMFLLLLLQYASWFVLIVPINWWHRRRGPAAYGLTRAGRSSKALLLAGLATAALAAWPSVTVLLVDSIYDLGETVPWRQAIFDTSWLRWEFWLFSAVLSWAFIPVVEELFYRGYVQRRLAEDWGDGPSIVGTSLLFVFAHGQYLMLNVYNVSLIASLLILAIAFGVMFAWTRSLVPCMIAHGIINFPMTPVWQGLFLAALVIGAVATSRQGLAVLKQVFSGASVTACVALGIIGAGYAIASQRVEALVYAAAAMVVVAVVLEALDRRRFTQGA